MDVNFMDKLTTIQFDLPKQQQKVCKYIIEHIDDASTMTINEVATRSEVGTTTVLRFIEKVGYKKYPDFKKDAIQYVFNRKKNTWWHLQKSLEEMDDTENAIVTVGNSSIQDIESMVRNLNTEEYASFLKTLLDSTNVYFLGMRTSKSIAFYFEMMLRGILDQLGQLSWNPEFLYDESLNFKKGDTVVVIALSPYSTQTIDFVKYCYEQTAASIALITDLETCPMIQYSDTYLIAGQSKKRYSIIPVIAIVEALIIDLGKNQPDSITKIKKLNEIHLDNNITTS